jgi:hypothetical protein
MFIFSFKNEKIDLFSKITNFYLTMWQKTLPVLKNFSLHDLHQLRGHLDLLIKKKTHDQKSALDKRASHRANVKIFGTAEIEREREFFDQTHKVSIHQMSINGMVLNISTTVIQDDILVVTFRLPSNGEKKIINLQAMRVKETLSDRTALYEVAAKAVDKNTVKVYRNMLKNRGKKFLPS